MSNATDDAPSIPHNLHAERSVLAAMLLGRKGITEARALLRPEHFYRDAYGRIYSAMCELDDEGIKLDHISVHQRLKSTGQEDLVGGYEAIGQILEYATTTANTHHHARIIFDAHSKREIHAAARDIAAESLNGSLVPDLIERLADAATRIRAAHDALSGPGRYGSASSLLPALMDTDYQPPRPLLAGGLLSVGELAVLYGQPGTGKTWLALQLALCITRGAPWLALPTGDPDARVGIIELEVHAQALQERFRSLLNAMGDSTHDASLELVTRPALRGPVDFCDPIQCRDLERWIVDRHLSLVILDALSRMHSAKEASEMDVPLRHLEAVAQTTECAILIIHHERKQQGEVTDNDLDALRGDSRLQSNPTLLMRLLRLKNGLLCLRFPKVNLGQTPAPIHYAKDDSGLPMLTNPPIEQSQLADSILDLLRDAYPQSRARSEIQASLGIKRTTVCQELATLTKAGMVESSGDNRNRRYRSVQPSATVQNDARTVTNDLL